jgi:2-methylcitrate dehydratase PrpD
MAGGMWETVAETLTARGEPAGRGGGNAMGMRENAMGATDRLVQFIADTHYNTLPQEVVSAAKIGIMDGIANMLAGATQPLAAVISAYVQRLGGAPLCSVVGHDLKSNAPSAAFANGVFLHCLDFEIQGQPPTHGTSAILPPALALGEMSSAPGARLIEAYVIGWELQARFRRASSRCNLRGFHPPGLFGPVGAAAASSKMLGLDQTQTCMALGIAASHTGGLTANTGTMVKSTHPGSAARQGVEAALLAQAGFLSHDSIIEAHQGYVDVLFGTEFAWDALTRDLGTTFQLVTPGFNIKRYPAQLYMQWAIEAALTLQQRYHIRAEDVTFLELEVPAGQVRRGDANVRSGLDGKFSFAYCGAIALAEGRVDIDSFSDATRFSPRVEALLPKVRIKANPDIPTSTPDTWAVARVGLGDGRELSEQCRHYRGSIANPMTRDERLSKVRACAQRSLQPEDVERVIGMVEALETLADLRQLMGILGHKSVP